MVWAWGGLGLQFQENRSFIFPWLRLLTRAEGGAGILLAHPGMYSPCPARCNASAHAMAYQNLLCRPRSLTAPARTPTMPRNCWQCLGAMRWTLPRWGLQCSTFVQRPPFTGHVEWRVSGSRLCGEVGLPLDSLGRGKRSPWGFTEAPAPRAPEAAAHLPVHRHLLSKQHLRVSVLLLPPRLSGPAWPSPQDGPITRAMEGSCPLGQINHSTWL